MRDPSVAPCHLFPGDVLLAGLPVHHDVGHERKEDASVTAEPLGHEAADLIPAGTQQRLDPAAISGP